MRVIVAPRAAGILIFLFALSACGELETLFPSNGSYQVKAWVNGSALEDCSIIRSEDTIRPYFAVPVVNDPDLIGLAVYLQNSQGEITGGKIRYILEAYAEPVPTEPEIPEEEDSDEINEETEAAEDGAARRTQPAANTKAQLKTMPVEITVKTFSQELPFLPLQKNLEIGSYTLVFEALGKEEILSRTEADVFYLGSAEFNLKDITMYLPGLSGPQLISPGTTVMLETRLDFDSRFDPYVIWYNGKNIISEGKISDGAKSILWKAPEQAGFYTLRIEAFPFHLKNKFTGLSREITLPVSPKALSMGYFFEDDPAIIPRSPLAAGTVYPEYVQLITAALASEESGNEMPVMPSVPELLQWYQFEGNLYDSLSLPDEEQIEADSEKKTARWAAAEQSYGLSVEPNDAYPLSPAHFFRKEKNQGGGIFLLHIKPLSSGSVFSVFFPSQSSASDGAWMEMYKEDNVITLRLRAGASAVEMPVYFDSVQSQGLSPIVVEFYIRPYRLEAKISLNNEHSLQNTIGNIKLPGALTGEGRIKLGGVIEEFSEENIIIMQTTTQVLVQSIPPLTEALSEESMIDSTEDADMWAPVETPATNTIWDELAILFLEIPLLPEEFFIEQESVAETGDTETEYYSP